MFALIKIKADQPTLLHILMILQHNNAIIFKEHSFLALALSDPLILVRLAHINTFDLCYFSCVEDKFIFGGLGVSLAGVEVVSRCDDDIGGN